MYSDVHCSRYIDNIFVSLHYYLELGIAVIDKFYPCIILLLHDNQYCSACL